MILKEDLAKIEEEAWSGEVVKKEETVWSGEVVLNGERERPGS